MASSATIPEEAKYLFDGRHFGHLATVMADGRPQSTVVWIDRDGDAVLVNTALGRHKPSNIERDPRVALSVHDENDPYVYATLQGRAELIREGAIEHIHKLSRRYRNRDYSLKPGEERVIVRIAPERVFVRM